MVCLGSFADVKLMIVWSDEVKDGWAIIYFHVDKLFKVVSRRNIDLRSFVVLGFLLIR